MTIELKTYFRVLLLTPENLVAIAVLGIFDDKQTFS